MAMRRTAITLLLALSCGACCPRPQAVAAGALSPEPRTEDEKAVYAMGVALSKQVASLHLSEAEAALLSTGLTDGVLGRPHKAEPADYAEQLGSLADGRSAAAAAGTKKAGVVFLAKLAAEPGAKTFPTGLVFTSVVEGSGRTPLLNESVRVHYRGSLADGTVVDSTDKETEAAAAPMSRVIPCWSQALQLMKEGGKARIGCPSSLAYGDRGLPPSIPPGAALQFEVELVAVVR